MPTTRSSYDRSRRSVCDEIDDTSRYVDAHVNHGKKYAFGFSHDAKSLLLLLLLYTLQGVPMGLSASISFLLQERGASLSDIGYFSLSSWPFSLKVIWAPVVDSIYFHSFGRRRSWVLPLQALVGLTFILTSSKINYLISDEGSDIRSLTFIFFKSRRSWTDCKDKSNTEKLLSCNEASQEVSWNSFKFIKFLKNNLEYTRNGVSEALWWPEK